MTKLRIESDGTPTGTERRGGGPCRMINGVMTLPYEWQRKAAGLQ